jgi:hypothetical protein
MKQFLLTAAPCKFGDFIENAVGVFLESRMPDIFITFCINDLKVLRLCVKKFKVLYV